MLGKSHHFRMGQIGPAYEPVVGVRRLPGSIVSAVESP